MHSRIKWDIWGGGAGNNTLCEMLTIMDEVGNDHTAKNLP